MKLVAPAFFAAALAAALNESGQGSGAIEDEPAFKVKSINWSWLLVGEGLFNALSETVALLIVIGVVEPPVGGGKVAVEAVLKLDDDEATASFPYMSSSRLWMLSTDSELLDPRNTCIAASSI